jgi:hypothetical protein
MTLFDSIEFGYKIDAFRSSAVVINLFVDRPGDGIPVQPWKVDR